jgi:hypothetical protein
VQTFLPRPSFAASAACLDDRRLGKQVVEGCQIMRCLTSTRSSGWYSHPIVSAWRGHEIMLMRYLDAMHADWQSRRRNPAVHSAYFRCRRLFDGRHFNTDEPPWWLGSPGFHLSHQLNLIRKDNVYRAKFTIPSSVHVENEPYLWPANPGFFQVATRSNGADYVSWFSSGQVTGKRLMIPVSEADDRARTLFPEAVRLIGANMPRECGTVLVLESNVTSYLEEDSNGTFHRIDEDWADIAHQKLAERYSAILGTHVTVLDPTNETGAGYNGFRVKTAGGYHADVFAMIFSWRLALVPVDEVMPLPRWYWCYAGRDSASLALAMGNAALYDGSPGWRPIGFRKAWNE